MSFLRIQGGRSSVSNTWGYILVSVDGMTSFLFPFAVLDRFFVRILYDMIVSTKSSILFNILLIVVTESERHSFERSVCFDLTEILLDVPKSWTIKQITKLHRHG